MNRRPCKACGAPVLFIINGRTGQTVPLDVNSRAHMYELLDSDENGQVAYSVSQQEIYVSHFLTCPKASELSAKKKPTQGDLL